MPPGTREEVYVWLWVTYRHTQTCHMYTHLLLWAMFRWIETHRDTQAPMHTHTNTHPPTYAHMHTHTHPHPCTTHTHTHPHPCTMHTHTHTHTHTYPP